MVEDKPSTKKHGLMKNKVCWHETFYEGRVWVRRVKQLVILLNNLGMTSVSLKFSIIHDDLSNRRFNVQHNEEIYMFKTYLHISFPHGQYMFVGHSN